MVEKDWRKRSVRRSRWEMREAWARAVAGFSEGLRWDLRGFLTQQDSVTGWMVVRESPCPGFWLRDWADGGQHHSWSGKCRRMSPLCSNGALQPDREGCWDRPGHPLKGRWFTARPRRFFDKKIWMRPACHPPDFCGIPQLHGVSLLHLESIWFLEKLPKELILSWSRPSQFLSAQMHEIWLLLLSQEFVSCDDYSRLLFLLLFLVYVLSEVPFPPFLPPTSQGKLLSEKLLAIFFLVAFLMESFAFAEQKWKESASTCPLLQTGLSLSKGNGC